MSKKQYMFVVALDPFTSRFKIESAQDWLGERVYDFTDEQLRYLETDEEAQEYDALEDVLQMGLGHINKIFDDNSVSFDKGE